MPLVLEFLGILVFSLKPNRMSSKLWLSGIFKCLSYIIIQQKGRSSVESTQVKFKA